MPVIFTKGVSQEFIATRDFALNFEDRNVKSIKIKTGDSIFYDGEYAKHTRPNGELIEGRCPSLRSAINSMGWLVLKKEFKKAKSVNTPVPSFGDFDKLRGGNFDTYARQTDKDIHVQSTIIREKDLVVKEIPPVKKPERSESKTDLSVAKDQFEVKEGFVVSSSTSNVKEKKRVMPVVKRDEMGSEGTLNIKGIKAALTTNKKNSSFIINETTPRTINEDMTLDEVKKIRAVDESQEAVVIGKIDKAKIAAEVQNVDGIIMKKNIEGVTLTTGVQPQKEAPIKAVVTAGSEHISSIQDEGKIVSKVPANTDDVVNMDAKAKALARAEVRKKAASQAITRIKKNHAKDKGSTEADQKSSNTDYLSRLPADWGKMHWVKKEVFIKNQTDKEFIKFILSMETTKALQNACIERLKELE